jgi:ParB family chromosome partitioning protein
MAKLGANNQGTVKISIDQIREGDNVRTEYTGIEELAESIRTKGLLQPVILRPMGRTDESGIEQPFELVSGFRRLRAHRLLCEQGEDFRMIEAKIRVGDREVIQLVENVQREDISPRDLCAGIQRLLDRGMTKTEVAKELNKRLTFITDALAAQMVMENAERAGVSTEGLALHAASQLRSVPPKKQSEAVAETKRRGGSVRAATEVMREYKGQDAVPETTYGEYTVCRGCPYREAALGSGQ